MIPDVPESLLAINRRQTRERLLRSLYRAHARQQVVARRRTQRRQMLRALRWSASVIVASAILFWSGLQLGIIPQWRLVTADQLQASTTAGRASPEQVPVTRQEEHPMSEHLTTQTPAPPAAPASGLPVDGDHLPVQLKADSHLNSLMQ